MRKIAGYIGIGLMIIGMIAGFFGSLALISNKLGFIWAVVAFFLAPVTIALAPWYQWLSLGDSTLMIESYGYFLAGAVISGIANKSD